MKTTQITTYSTNRLKSSVNGNPRYELIDEPTGNIIGLTRPDSSIAYGPVPNHRGEKCKITIHTTPSGRRYVESVEPV